jgi:hypothetical protein
MTTHQHAEVLEAEPGHVGSGLNGQSAKRFKPERLARPLGPQTTRFSRRPTHSSVRNVVWVATGIDERLVSQAANVLPVGKAACSRRVANAERSRPAISSFSSTLRTSAGSQRCGIRSPSVGCCVTDAIGAPVIYRRLYDDRGTTTGVGSQPVLTVSAPAFPGHPRRQLRPT